MNIPRLSTDGFVHHDEARSDQAINYVLDYSMVELRGCCAHENFLSRIAALAVDVYACGLSWEPVAEVFRDFACIEGMSTEEADRLLALAWEWAPYRPGSWLQLCREWVWVLNLRSYYHLASDRYVDGEDLEHVFRDAFHGEDEMVTGGCRSVFAEVDRVISDPSRSRGFHRVEDATVFNAH